MLSAQFIYLLLSICNVLILVEMVEMDLEGPPIPITAGIFIATTWW
jgi:hypothetical protein